MHSNTFPQKLLFLWLSPCWLRDLWFSYSKIFELLESSHDGERVWKGRSEQKGSLVPQMVKCCEFWLLDFSFPLSSFLRASGLCDPNCTGKEGMLGTEKGLWAVFNSSFVGYNISIIFLSLLITGTLMEPVFILFFNTIKFQSWLKGFPSCFIFEGKEICLYPDLE